MTLDAEEIAVVLLTVDVFVTLVEHVSPQWSLAVCADKVIRMELLIEHGHDLK